ncbi:MAG: hypothetical protein C0392_14715 [Syntrophus sp. (in: bacteria)]|nr:hypothetical protein [Syntrophus sp. (in: bacteria)]
MHVRNNGSYLKYKEIDLALITRAVVIKPTKARMARKIYIPAKDHPWRRFKIKHGSRNHAYSQKEKVA